MRPRRADVSPATGCRLGRDARLATRSQAGIYSVCVVAINSGLARSAPPLLFAGSCAEIAGIPRSGARSSCGVQGRWRVPLAGFRGYVP